MDVIYKPRKTRHPIFGTFWVHVTIRKCCILEFITWKSWKIWSAEYCLTFKNTVKTNMGTSLKTCLRFGNWKVLSHFE